MHGGCPQRVGLHPAERALPVPARGNCDQLCLRGCPQRVGLHPAERALPGGVRNVQDQEVTE